MLIQFQARSRVLYPQIRHHTSPDPSPIAKLPQDVLLYIFQINANMTEDDLPERVDRGLRKPDPPRAIDTTRISSQVSFLWRDLIINAPLLWANLIDLQALDSAKSRWRLEVLRRTQSASLHVKGCISLDSRNPMNKTWLRFFNTNWERIRVFDIVLVSGDPSFSAERHLLRLLIPGAKHLEDRRHRTSRPLNPFLSRPTKVLESFRLRLPQRYSHKPIKFGLPLFNNYAPRLRAFDISNWPGCLTDQRYTWLSQVQNLNILEYTDAMLASVDIFYDILSQLPRLRSLYLSNVLANPSVSHNRAPIHLSSLNRIEIRSTAYDFVPIVNGVKSLPTLCWHVLDFIVPVPGCSILVGTSHFRKEDIPQAVTVFARYARNYLEVHHPTNLTLSTSPTMFDMTADPPQPKSRGSPFKDRPKDGLPFFDIRVRLYGFVGTEEMIHQIFQSFFSLSFPHVTNLTLNVALAHRDAFTDAQFVKMLDSFSSVETMTTTAPTLHFLMNSPLVDIKTVFQRLKYLHIPQKRGKEMSLLQIRYRDICAKFLDLRNEAGLPLSTDV